MARSGMLLALLLVLACCAAARADKRGYHSDPDRLVFPGPISPRKLNVQNNQLVSSLELAKQLSRLQTDDEFFELFEVHPAGLTEPYSITDRFGGVERSNAIKPKPALCIPELQVVPVKENPDPAAIYFPNCIRIKRCGGCCNHELLSCQPTDVETRNYQIHVTKLEADVEQYNVFKEIVALDEHIKCKCDCKIKEQDCTDKHYYVKDECRCICKNSDEESKCLQQHDSKYWDTNNCSCQCRNVGECTTGYFFDQNSCSCKNLPFSRHWLNNERRTGYNFRQTGKPKETPPVIVTLDATDPRRKHKEDPEYK